MANGRVVNLCRAYIRFRISSLNVTRSVEEVLHSLASIAIEFLSPIFPGKLRDIEQ